MTHAQVQKLSDMINFTNAKAILHTERRTNVQILECKLCYSAYSLSSISSAKLVSYIHLINIQIRLYSAIQFHLNIRINITSGVY